MISREDLGYTLLEVLVVVAIAALIASAAPVVYGKVVPTFETRQFAYDLVAELRERRERSIKSGVPEVIKFEPDERTFAEGEDIEHDEDIAVTYEPDAAWQIGDVSELYFFPNGSSNGGAIEVSRGSFVVMIKVDWVSGSIGVE